MAKILIISQGSAFMINTLENDLKKEGIDTVHCEPDSQIIDKKIIGSDMVLLFAGEYVKESAELVSHIASVCSDEFIPFCVAGYPKELSEIERLTEISLISAEFTRPFEMKDLVADLRALALGESAKSGVPVSVKKDKHHILICDDDVKFLRTMQEWLSVKYSVTAVRSGLMAISAAIINRPELILLDFHMPVVSGTQAMQMIRSERVLADIPIVFMAGQSDRESIINVMQLRPLGFMLKTQTMENTLALIDRYFETKQWGGVR